MIFSRLQKGRKSRTVDVKKNSARDEGETARNQRAEKREEGRRRGRHSLCKDEYRATDRECLYNPIFRSIAVLYAISHLCPGLPSHPTAYFPVATRAGIRWRVTLLEGTLSPPQPRSVFRVYIRPGISF